MLLRKTSSFILGLFAMVLLVAMTLGVAGADSHLITGVYNDVEPDGNWYAEVAAGGHQQWSFELAEARDHNIVIAIVEPSGANLSVSIKNGQELEIASGDEGLFSLSLESGPYAVTISNSGGAPVRYNLYMGFAFNILTVAGAGLGDGTMSTTSTISCTSNAGMTSGDCSETLTATGVDFDITASPAPGSELGTPVWTGCDSVSGINNEACHVHVLIDTTVTATFDLQSPEDGISNLQDDIQTLVDTGVLQPGQANGLIRPLNNALRSLDKDKTADACNQLQDFIDKVIAKTPKPLDEGTAAALIASAEAIRSSLGCDEI